MGVSPWLERQLSRARRARGAAKDDEEKERAAAAAREEMRMVVEVFLRVVVVKGKWKQGANSAPPLSSPSRTQFRRSR